MALHKFIRLRQRYILTKGNRLRLRYVAGSLACLAAGLVTMVGAANVSIAFVQPNAYDEAEISAAVLGDDYVTGVDSEDSTKQAILTRKITEGFERHISSRIKRVSASAKIEPRPLEQTVRLDNGDTLAGVLQKAGISGAEAYQAVKALSAHYDPRKVKPGQLIELRFDPAQAEELALSEVKMRIDPVTDVVVRKNGADAFKAELAKKEVKARSYAQHARIETSLYGSAGRAGIPDPIIAEVIRIYSWNVDFQRDIRRGDRIEVLYNTYETDEGDLVRYGEVLYANLSVGGKDIPVYRHKMANGDVDYFEQDGRSIRKTLMKTPIDGARLSSGFGMRKHPVLGYNKMHKGIDFAASLGTPIYAAGDGTIERAGRNGGYGNYVRIRHNSKLKTAYAHMHKFAKKTRKGARIKQGDIIGYVGTTGRSTGPHLHYEVLSGGKQVNPNRVDLPVGEKLKGKEMTRFKTLMASLNKQYVSLAGRIKVAQRDTKETKTYR